MRNMSQELVNRALKQKRAWSKFGKVMANVFIYVALILMYVPLIYIVVYSFTNARVLGQWSNFSLDSYKFLFKFGKNELTKELWKAVGNTVLVAVVSSLISVVIGTLGSIGMYYARKKWFKTTLEYVNQIPIVNAEIVTAFSLCILFIIITRIFKLETNAFTVILGHVVLSLPYVVLSVRPKLEQMDPSVYEAALDLGATETKALFKVVLPDIVPGILSGFLISITLSLDDYLITTFTKPKAGGFNTLSTYVWEKQAGKAGLPIQLRAFTAILIAVILIIMIGMNIKGAIDAKNLTKKENNKK